jgi:hypothetical protein
MLGFIRDMFPNIDTDAISAMIDSFFAGLFEIDYDPYDPYEFACFIP